MPVRVNKKMLPLIERRNSGSAIISEKFHVRYTDLYAVLRPASTSLANPRRRGARRSLGSALAGREYSEIRDLVVDPRT